MHQTACSRALQPYSHVSDDWVRPRRTAGIRRKQCFSYRPNAFAPSRWFIKEGREQEAAQQYLAAHVQFQKVILGYFE